MKQSNAAELGAAQAPPISPPGSIEAGSPPGDVAADKRKSLLRYSPAFVLLAILVADSNRHTDPDLWGHIRFGQEFIAHHHLVETDPYSYSALKAPWHDYEWLAEVVMAWVYNLGGVLGLKLWKLTCTALIVGFITDTLAVTGASLSIQFPILLICAIGLVPQMQFRPQMFTFVILSVLIDLLARDTYKLRMPLWICIPMMLLWVNLHAGFFVGIIALAIYTAARLSCDIAGGGGWQHGAMLALITIGALAVTLVNPLGASMWSSVVRTLSQPYTRGAISEWQPTIHAVISQWNQQKSGVLIYLPFGLLLLGFFATFMLCPRGADLPLVAVAVPMCFAALLSARNMALAVIAVSAPLASRLTSINLRRITSQRPGSAPQVKPVFALLMCAFLIFQTDLSSGRLMLDSAYPAGALEFMGEHGLHGNILSEWAWGGYLIWHGAPSDKVFVDGRSDSVYPLGVIRDFLLFRFDLTGGGQVLNAYPHDFVLISPGAPARHLMERRSDWKLVYRDRDSLLYARANSSAAKIPGTPVIGSSSPAGGFP